MEQPKPIYDFTGKLIGTISGADIAEPRSIDVEVTIAFRSDGAQLEVASIVDAYVIKVPKEASFQLLGAMMTSADA